MEEINKYYILKDTRSIQYYFRDTNGFKLKIDSILWVRFYSELLDYIILQNEKISKFNKNNTEYKLEPFNFNICINNFTNKEIYEFLSFIKSISVKDICYNKIKSLTNIDEKFLNKDLTYKFTPIVKISKTNINLSFCIIVYSNHKLNMKNIYYIFPYYENSCYFIKGNEIKHNSAYKFSILNMIIYRLFYKNIINQFKNGILKCLILS